MRSAAGTDCDVVYARSPGERSSRSSARTGSSCTRGAGTGRARPAARRCARSASTGCAGRRSHHPATWKQPATSMPSRSPVRSRAFRGRGGRGDGRPPAARRPRGADPLDPCGAARFGEQTVLRMRVGSLDWTAGVLPACSAATSSSSGRWSWRACAGACEAPGRTGFQPYRPQGDGAGMIPGDEQGHGARRDARPRARNHSGCRDAPGRAAAGAAPKPPPFAGSRLCPDADGTWASAIPSWGKIAVDGRDHVGQQGGLEDPIRGAAADRPLPRSGWRRASSSTATRGLLVAHGCRAAGVALCHRPCRALQARLVASSPQPPTKFAAVGLGLVVASGASPSPPEAPRRACVRRQAAPVTPVGSSGPRTPVTRSSRLARS